LNAGTRGLGAVSYAAATPGALFAPMLVLGAQVGPFLGLLCRLAIPDLVAQPEGFAVVGIAAFLTGVVRAALTGSLLLIEMRASVTMLLSMPDLIPDVSGESVNSQRPSRRCGDGAKGEVVEAALTEAIVRLATRYGRYDYWRIRRLCLTRASRSKCTASGGGKG
jgi:hypothetical protein